MFASSIGFLVAILATISKAFVANNNGGPLLFPSFVVTNRPRGHRHEPASSASSLKQSSNGRVSDFDRVQFREAMQDPFNIATLLYGTILERRAQELDFSFDGILARLTPSYKEARKAQQVRIEELIQDLVERNTPYDPTESLLGDLFCTVYTTYNNAPKNAPDPLWERISIKQENLKGQQYFISSRFDYQVINYAEIYGSDVHLRAKGSFVPAVLDSSNGSSSSFKKRPNSLQTRLLGPLFPVDQKMRETPDVFDVTVSSASIHLWGISLSLPIRGTSQLVVLYADSRIRIFISPLENNAGSYGAGNWENSGLIAVQIRSDLATGEDPMDLR
jgi:hypothetical protein